MIKQAHKLLSSHLYRLKQCAIFPGSTKSRPSSFEAPQCQSNKHSILGRQIFCNQTSLSQKIRFNFCSKKKQNKNRYIGTTNFDTLSLFNLYVDKTLFLKTFTEISQQSMIMFPRRFGKSTTLSMIQHYFEFQELGSSEQKASQNMFFGERKYHISDDKEFRQEHFQKYGVITLDFSQIGFNNKSKGDAILIQIQSHLAQEIRLQYERHSYILKKLPKRRQGLYQKQLKILDKCAEGNGTFQDYQHITKSIRFLSIWLHQYHKKKIIILIDEYDSYYQELLRNIQDPEILETCNEYFKKIYKYCFKSNKSIYRALVTGILSLSQKQMMSGANHFSVYDITSIDLADFYGINEQELKTILKQPMFNSLKKQDESNLIQNIRRYYNGYNIVRDKREISRFNVFSVTSYLFDVIQRGLEPNTQFKDYWCDSGRIDNQFMNFIVKDCTFVSKQFLKLLAASNNTDYSYTLSMKREDCMTSQSLLIIKSILSRSALSSEHERNQQMKKIALMQESDVIKAVFSFLTYAGYLSYVKGSYRIPNLEVKMHLIERILQIKIFSLKKPVEIMMEILKRLLNENDQQVISQEQCKAQMQTLCRQLSNYYFKSQRLAQDKDIDIKNHPSPYSYSTPPIETFINEALFHSFLFVEIINHSFIRNQKQKGLVSIQPVLKIRRGKGDHMKPDIFIRNEQTKRSIIIEMKFNVKDGLYHGLKKAQEVALRTGINRFCDICFCIVINIKNDLTIEAAISREDLRNQKKPN